MKFSLKYRRRILSQQIYVFTPKGDVMELPSGSTQ